MKINLTKKNRKDNYIVLAENFYLDDRKENAVKSYKKALSFSEDEDETIDILYNIAFVYDEMGMAKEALEMYRRITEISSEEVGAFYGMATMYERLDKKDIALDFYFKAVEKNSEYDRAYFYIANLYDELGKKDLAI